MLRWVSNHKCHSTLTTHWMLLLSSQDSNPLTPRCGGLVFHQSNAHHTMLKSDRLPRPSGHRFLGGDHKCTRHLHLTQPLVEFTVFPRPSAHRCLGEDSTTQGSFVSPTDWSSPTGSSDPQVIVGWGESTSAQGTCISPSHWLSLPSSQDPQLIVVWGETSTTQGSFISPTDWLSPTGSPDPQVIVIWGEDFSRGINISPRHGLSRQSYQDCRLVEA